MHTLGKLKLIQRPNAQVTHLLGAGVGESRNRCEKSLYYREPRKPARQSGPSSDPTNHNSRPGPELVVSVAWSEYEGSCRNDLAYCDELLF